MLQRLVTAAAVFYSAIPHLHPASQFGSIAPQVIDVGAGVFLLLGLWTPAAGVVVASRQLWLLLCGSGDPWLALVIATLGATLAMIGPGSWSIDARLFGRKQIKRLR